MSDFIFACPKCHQNLTCDTSYVGQQITCPLCNQAVVVPPAVAAKSGSGLIKGLIVSGIVIVVCAVLGAGGWFGWHLYSAHKGKGGNPEAEVPVPTAASAMQALSILTKVHSAYTNLTTMSAKADGTLTVFLNLTNITIADVSPNAKNPPKNPNRSQQAQDSFQRFG